MEIKNRALLNQINKAKKGDQGAFKYLLDSFWNVVYGFQMKRVKNEYEAEDITIETFSKAFDKIETFDEKYTFETWLITISKNIHIDKTRKKNASIFSKPTGVIEDQLNKIVDGSPTPEDILITKQNLAELLSYIKELKPLYQEAINLRYFREMSYLDISESLQQPLSNVKVRLLRARKLLAEIIIQKDKA